jgi:putative inorganic carbon (hco3(-)) transporter
MTGPPALVAAAGESARQPNGRPGVRGSPSPTTAAGVLTLAACLALALLVGRIDVPALLVLALGAAGGMVLLSRPHLATLLVVFLLYTNIPVLAYKLHGVPQPIAGAFLLLLLIPLGHFLVVRRERPRMDRTFGLMLVYLVVLVVASLRARDPLLAGERIQTFVLEGLLLYWLLLNVLRGTSMLRRVLWVMLTAGALLGGLSLYQEVTGDFRQQFGGLAHRNYEFMVLENQLASRPGDPSLRERKAAMTSDRSRRAEGPMDEPNAYGQIMLLLLPLGLYLARTAASRPARVGAALLGILVLGGMLASQSRGALVALGLVAVAAASIRWIRPAHLLLCVLAVGLVAPFLLSDRLAERIGRITSVVELVEGDGAGNTDHAIRGRATQMLAALQVFTDYPVLGVGPGQYAPFYSVEYQQRDPRFKFKDLAVTRRAHSLYLETAAELGVLGMLAFFSIIGLLMRDLWRARRRWAGRGGGRDQLVTALWLSLLAYLATSIFLHLMYQRYYWLLLAVAGAALAALRAEEAEEARAAEAAAVGTRGWTPGPGPGWA